MRHLYRQEILRTSATRAEIQFMTIYTEVSMFRKHSKQSIAPKKFGRIINILAELVLYNCSDRTYILTSMPKMT